MKKMCLDLRSKFVIYKIDREGRKQEHIKQTEQDPVQHTEICAPFDELKESEYWQSRRHKFKSTQSFEVSVQCFISKSSISFYRLIRGKFAIYLQDKVIKWLDALLVIWELYTLCFDYIHVPQLLLDTFSFLTFQSLCICCCFLLLTALSSLTGYTLLFKLYSLVTFSIHIYLHMST